MIIGGKDEVVFAGTKQQVEDWLDHEENLHPRPSARGAWHGSLVQVLLWPFRRVWGCCHSRVRIRRLY
jgi:hypothetical protein